MFVGKVLNDINITIIVFAFQNLIILYDILLLKKDIHSKKW